MSASQYYPYAQHHQQQYYAVPVIAQPAGRQPAYAHVPNPNPPQAAQTVLTRRCNECTRGFTCSAELESHQNYGRAIQCSVCSIYCSCWDALARHQILRHAQQHLPSSGPASPASPS